MSNNPEQKNPPSIEEQVESFLSDLESGKKIRIHSVFRNNIRTDSGEDDRYDHDYIEIQYSNGFYTQYPIDSEGSVKDGGGILDEDEVKELLKKSLQDRKEIQVIFPEQFSPDYIPPQPPDLDILGLGSVGGGDERVLGDPAEGAWIQKDHFLSNEIDSGRLAQLFERIKKDNKKIQVEGGPSKFIYYYEGDILKEEAYVYDEIRSRTPVSEATKAAIPGWLKEQNGTLTVI